MTFVIRRYEEIVQDMLTVLTKGTVRESHKAPEEDEPIVLTNRPVRRVSHLKGTIRVPGADGEERDVPYQFTAADFELFSTSGDETRKDAVRFRKGRPRPAVGTYVVVNYYPVQTKPVELTDLNVGSVVRTLMETFGRELTLAYLNLEQVYRAAFLETAEGSALDRVVALVGLQRLPSGRPVATVRFSREDGSAGRITIPVGTTVTDDEGNRYLSTAAVTLEPGETSRDVIVAGGSAGTKEVEAGKLDRMESLVAGLGQPTNPQAAVSAGAAETDDELRRRARESLHTAVRGTLPALRYGLKAIDGVNDLTITEEPNGVAGEIRIDVAFGKDTQEVRDRVDERIRELKPAGIRVLTGQAKSVAVSVRAELTLAGSSLPEADRASLQSDAEERISDYLAGLSPGGKARSSRLVSLVMEDSRVADAVVTLIPEQGVETPDLSLDKDQVLKVNRPFTFSPPLFEEAPAGTETTTAFVSALLPLRLEPGVTLAEAQDAIILAGDGYLALRVPGSPLTVDGLAAAVRDETRYALVRDEVIVTVECGDRFFQLTDGVGEYNPQTGQTLTRKTFDVTPREGSA